jgi:hypothetical protein
MIDRGGRGQRNGNKESHKTATARKFVDRSLDLKPPFMHALRVAHFFSSPTYDTPRDMLPIIRLASLHGSLPLV